MCSLLLSPSFSIRSFLIVSNVLLTVKFTTRPIVRIDICEVTSIAEHIINGSVTFHKLHTFHLAYVNVNTSQKAIRAEERRKTNKFRRVTDRLNFKYSSLEHSSLYFYKFNFNLTFSALIKISSSSRHCACACLHRDLLLCIG